jgi:hypothetical protein
MLSVSCYPNRRWMIYSYGTGYQASPRSHCLISYELYKKKPGMRTTENESRNLIKKYPFIGCCGIDCALCPRYHTTGTSRCPGCLGPGFSEKHPSCSIANCCFGSHGLETCADCDQFICHKIEKWDLGDSFVTHQVSLQNLRTIRATGIAAYNKQQTRRLSVLSALIKEYDDGWSKSFYCLATALLPIDAIEAALQEVNSLIRPANDRKATAKLMREAFGRIAADAAIELSYRRQEEL